MSPRFEKFQPNPKDAKLKHYKRGDCTTRALCGLLSIDWSTAFELQVEHARKEYDETNGDETLKSLLESMGYKYHSIKVSRGDSRPTVNEFAGQHREPCYIRVSGHVTYCKDGKFYDSWDCGEYKVYSYYSKSE